MSATPGSLYGGPNIYLHGFLEYNDRVMHRIPQGRPDIEDWSLVIHCILDSHKIRVMVIAANVQFLLHCNFTSSTDARQHQHSEREMRNDPILTACFSEKRISTPLRSVELPIAPMTEGVALFLSQPTGVQACVAFHAAQTRLVPSLPNSFHLLRKIHGLLTPRTYRIASISPISSVSTGWGLYYWRPNLPSQRSAVPSASSVWDQGNAHPPADHVPCYV